MIDVLHFCLNIYRLWLTLFSSSHYKNRAISQADRLTMEITSLPMLSISKQKFQFPFTTSRWLFSKTGESNLHLQSVLQFKNISYASYIIYFQRMLGKKHNELFSLSFNGELQVHLQATGLHLHSLQIYNCTPVFKLSSVWFSFIISHHTYSILHVKVVFSFPVTISFQFSFFKDNLLLFNSISFLAIVFMKQYFSIFIDFYKGDYKVLWMCQCPGFSFCACSVLFSWKIFFSCRETEREWILERGKVRSLEKRSGGQGNCGQNALYETKIYFSKNIDFRIQRWSP